jgi:hypothetical protein
MQDERFLSLVELLEILREYEVHRFEYAELKLELFERRKLVDRDRVEERERLALVAEDKRTTRMSRIGNPTGKIR